MRERSPFDFKINVGYHAAQMQSRVVRAAYRRTLPWRVRRRVSEADRAHVAVYAFSCERDLAEQIVSIYSFLRHVGVPDRFTVISDGSYTESSRRLLGQVHPCVSVVDWQTLPVGGLPACVREYARDKPLGKKLASLMALTIDRPTIFVDSDIKFFPRAAELLALCLGEDERPRCLQDFQPALDERLLRDEERGLAPVNSGLLVLRRNLDWSLGVDRLSRLQEPPSYFTEQTTIHLTMHDNGAQLLPADRYIVQIDDQYTGRDVYARRDIAARHYVTPVRSKLWLNVV